jgi:hypothetical protein
MSRKRKHKNTNFIDLLPDELLTCVLHALSIDNTRKLCATCVKLRNFMYNLDVLSFWKVYLNSRDVYLCDHEYYFFFPRPKNKKEFKLSKCECSQIRELIKLILEKQIPKDIDSIFRLFDNFKYIQCKRYTLDTQCEKQSMLGCDYCKSHEHVFECRVNEAEERIFNMELKFAGIVMYYYDNKFSKDTDQHTTCVLRKVNDKKYFGYVMSPDSYFSLNSTTEKDIRSFLHHNMSKNLFIKCKLR